MAVVAGSHVDAASGDAAAVPRRKKTAAERRSQRSRAQARAVAHLLAGFKEVESHRGNAVSKTATTFSRALRCLSSGGWVLHEKTVASATSSVASSCGAELATSVGLEVRDADVVPALREVRGLQDEAASTTRLRAAEVAPAPVVVGRLDDAASSGRLRAADVAPAPDGVGLQGLLGELQGLRGEAASSIRLRAAEVAPAPDGVGFQEATVSERLPGADVATAPGGNQGLQVSVGRVQVDGSASAASASAADVYTLRRDAKAAETTAVGCEVRRPFIDLFQAENCVAGSDVGRSSTSSSSRLACAIDLAIINDYFNEGEGELRKQELRRWFLLLHEMLRAALASSSREDVNFVGSEEDFDKLQVDVRRALWAYDEATPRVRFGSLELDAIKRSVKKGRRGPGASDVHKMSYVKLLQHLQVADPGLVTWHLRVDGWRQQVLLAAGS
jgi:hypothetical protein